MSKSTVGQRIAGAVIGPLARIAGAFIGVLAVGVPPGLLLGYHMMMQYTDFDRMTACLVFGGLAFLAGALPGAAAGATLAQRLLKQRSDFWRALVGAVACLLLGAVFYLPVALLQVEAHYDQIGSDGLFPQLILYLFIGTILLSPVTIATGAGIGSGRKARPAPAPVKAGEELSQG